MFSFCIFFSIGLFFILKGILASKENNKRQLIYVFVAYFIGMCAGVEYFSAVFGIIHRPPLDDYILILTFSVLAYALLKHRLLEINIVIKNAFFYGILAVSITALYGSLIFFSQKLLDSGIIIGKYANGIILILAISLLLRPLELFLHSLLDKKFYKGTLPEIAEQKERLQSELERRERLKSVGILAAGMAHEIKNPITAIKTFAEYLPSKGDDPEFREKFSRIVNQEVDRIKDIVTNLLLFSKPQEPSAKICDLNKIIKDTTDLLRSECLKYKIRLSTQLQEDLPKILVDPDQIKQALINIVMNAIDAMKARPGELCVSTSCDAKHVLIEIQDHGCGIPEDKLKNIFDPFYTDKERGTGLGLAITHSIVEKNKGAVRVSSQVGVGTTFTLSFPASG